MKIYTDETKSERTAIEAVAVKATASVGRGSNALHYQVRDASGRWHCVVK
jgi:penicillin V acylase-like amidase (Ntn superfamily)